MKKILFVSTSSSVFHIPLWEAFESFGYQIYFVDYRGHPFVATENLAHRALHRLPKKLADSLYAYGNRKINQKILKIAYEVKPDIIFASKAKYMDMKTLDELRTIAPTINWYVDQMTNWGTIQKVVGCYDYFFNYDRYLIDLLQKQGHKNTYHLPWAGYINKNSQWPDKSNYKYNLTFIGSYHPEIFPRESSFDGLEELGLNIWGNKEWLKTKLKNCYRGKIVPNQGEVQKVYRESKIGLYLDSVYDVPGTGVTLRPFEITSAGAMMLGQVYRKELPELFEDGKDFISFNGVDELRTKARYYLNHEEERKKIAKAGFEKTRTDHTYIDRVRKVFEIVGGHSKKNG